MHGGTDSMRPARAHGRRLPRRDPIARLPVLVLFVHSRCDCRCVMCDIWKTRAPSELTPDDLTRLARDLELLKVRRIGLSGGEPLMHSNLWALCAPLREAGIRLTLLTTGLLLEPHALNVTRFFDDVIVSLDGPEPTHDRIRRVPGAFGRMAAGVAAVRRIDPAARVTGRCTVQRANFRELRRTVRAAHELTLDGISFLAADSTSDAFGRRSGWSEAPAAPLRLARDDLPALLDELGALERDCASDFATGFISDSRAKLKRRLWRHFAALHGLAPFPVTHCNAPWVSSVIESDGTVRPCFFHAPIGNVRRDGSLVSVLNGPAALGFRRSLDVRRNPTCQRCVCSLSLRETDVAAASSPGESAGPVAHEGGAGEGGGR